MGDCRKTTTAMASRHTAMIAARRPRLRPAGVDERCCCGGVNAGSSVSTGAAVADWVEWSISVPLASSGLCGAETGSSMSALANKPGCLTL